MHKVPPKRKTRKQKVAEHLQKLENNRYKIQWSSIKWDKIFVNVLFFLGFMLLVLVINIYEETIIDWRILLVLWLFVGLLVAPLLNKLVSKFYKASGFSLPVLYNLNIWGSLFIYLFMAINYYFPKSKERNITVKILESGYNSGKGCYTYAHVIMEGRKKELVFPCSFEIKNYASIDLIIAKGFWGFDIIKSKIPRNE
ncbi:MAG: hypothetical protein ACK4TA_19005 [Saprospiraceae bacterium]